MSCVSVLLSVSPVTWTFLALLALVAWFLLWLLYRARGRWLNAHQVHVRDEVAAVMAAGAGQPVFDEEAPHSPQQQGQDIDGPSPPMPMQRGGRQQHLRRFEAHVEIADDASSSSSPPLNPQPHPRSQPTLAPPNSAALSAHSPLPASVSPVDGSGVGVGSLLPIPPVVCPPTAVGDPSTAPPSAAEAAHDAALISGDSSLASSPASIDHAHPMHPPPPPAALLSASSPMSSPSLVVPSPPAAASSALSESPVALSQADWNSSSPVAITYTPHAAASMHHQQHHPAQSTPPPPRRARARGAARTPLPPIITRDDEEAERKSHGDAES